MESLKNAKVLKAEMKLIGDKDYVIYPLRWNKVFRNKEPDSGPHQKVRFDQLPISKQLKRMSSTEISVDDIIKFINQR